MIKIFANLSIALLLLVLCSGNTQFIVNSFNVSGGGGGPSCSGDMTDGDTEDFEASEGNFCTTDWTESDTDTVVSTYSTGQAHCGTHSLSIVEDSDNTNDNQAYVNFGGTDNDFSYRVYVWIPTLASGAYVRPMLTSSTTSNSDGSYLQIYNTGAEYQIKIRTDATNPSEYFVVTTGQKYRLEVNVDANPGDTTMKVYNSSEVGIETNNGGGDYIQTVASDTQAVQYLRFRDHSSSATASTVYFDDVKIDLSGSGELGVQSCE